MIYKVKLRLFQDDATGDWGFAHSNAVDVPTPFNAFWTQQGIFHDVFEHYFEDNNSPFYGDAAFNIGGEVAAMGHLAYYWSTFYLNERRFTSRYYPFEEVIMNGTLSDMQEAISEGYSHFGSELICPVPYQKPGNSMLEDIIFMHWDRVKQLNVKTEYQEDIERARLFKRSVSSSKLQRLYGWGFHQAEKICPRSEKNRNKLEQFLEFWKKFVERHDAEELSRLFRYLEFQVRTGENFDYRSTWITHEGERIKGETLYPEELLMELNYNE